MTHAGTVIDLFCGAGGGGRLGFLHGIVLREIPSPVSDSNWQIRQPDGKGAG